MRFFWRRYRRSSRVEEISYSSVCVCGSSNAVGNSCAVLSLFPSSMGLARFLMGRCFFLLLVLFLLAWTAEVVGAMTVDFRRRTSSGVK